MSFESLKRIIPSVGRGDGCARALCMNGACRPCAVTPLVLQGYISCLLLLVWFFGSAEEERCPLGPAVQTQLEIQI